MSGTQIKAAILASDVAVPGTARVTVFNPGQDTSNALTFTVTSPAPFLSALLPSSVPAGSAGLAVLVFGSGFLANSVVRWNGSDRPTTFLTSSQLQFLVSTDDLAIAGTAQVTVFSPPPGGNSNALTFTITQAQAPNPAPSIDSLSPSSATAGGAAFAVTVNGTNFVPSSLVRWNGSNRSTVFLSSTQLQASILAADIATAEAAQVTVFNPPPGGGVSNALAFTIISSSSANPVPLITSISPNSASARGDDFVLTVTGSGFVQSSVVRWNGANRLTLFLSSTRLQGAIPTGDLAETGTAQVTVFNPGPGGGTSNAVPFAITASTPTSTLDVSPEFLNFEALQGGPNPASQIVQITSPSGANVQWTAAARTSAGGDWLRLSTTSGTTPSFLFVRLSSGNLASGVYTGLITVSEASGAASTVAVTLLVKRPVPSMQLSQFGFIFQAVEGASAAAPQTFQVLNLGQGTMNWQARITNLEGGSWLSLTPLSGTSQGGSQVPPAAVKVDPSQLKSGLHWALINFEAPEAPNSPQPGIVLVNILPPGSEPLGLIQPAGLIFVGAAAGPAPPAQELTLSSTGGRALQFALSVRASGGNWLTITPSSGTLAGTGAPMTLRAQVNASGLPAGVYLGNITVNLSTGKSQDAPVVLLVTASSSATGIVAFASQENPSQLACSPSRMEIVETLLAANFTLAGGWPASLRAQAVDDCGQPVTGASVTASFSNGDPSLALTNLKDGRYVGSWKPINQGSVVVTLRALAPNLPEKTLRLEGTVAASNAPVAFRNGLVNAASFAKNEPLAPGSLFSLFGRNLATRDSQAPSVPLPTELGDVRVVIGGLEAPLLFASGAQVNGQVPAELDPANTAVASLVVTVRGGAASTDEIKLSPVQPGVFTVGSGSQGAILNRFSELVSTSRPATTGEILQVFCNGLGLTTPKIPSGLAAPANPLARVTAPVVVNIGGVDVTPDFAGLAPGFVALYQVNARVPEGVVPGIAVPLFITQGGVKSNTVTFALR